MKRDQIILMIAGLWLLAASGYAQMQRERVTADGAVEEIFWAPNLVGMSTVENLGANSMNVTIMHNFGIVTDRPLQNFFGFDFGPNVRLGIDYGLTDHWSAGIGRTTFEKVVDLRTNVSLLNQTINDSVPLSVSLKVNVALTTVENNRPVGDDLSYLLSLAVARKFSGVFSFQLAPMYAHFNTVDAGEQEDLFALGIGGELHLSRRYALMAEYYPVLGERNPGTKNAFSLGLNIETGGHVFQLYFASAQWHTEQFIIARNREDFWAGDFRFGFNVNRLFSL